ncbi:nitric oxide reductase activation protein NorD [Methylotenera mobilis]|uniref:von Willebrand factor type A n=1 Tax=Methylotenera mobilis (strain JLW8 / ATCC BAA-1282 / DSM 17540) TaxID=583345 RepID=C6WVL5_METML|nr:VWA domain-containing protein [Methylotenera mobilis]ACT47964.1 von Willebrand factor type A [Methylotenera mobilis JLW8]
MEEYVGELWDRLITGAAEKRHAAAAVKLDDIAKSAAIFFRALGGDSGLGISAAPAIRHGARRRLLQRMAGSGEKIELSWRDGEVLRLPSQIDLFAEYALNRDLYFWLVALAAVDSDSNQPWIVRNQHATQSTLQRFPGLQGRYTRLVEALLAMRTPPHKLPADEAAQEHAIRQALQYPGTITEITLAKRPFQPVPLWPHPNPPVSVTSSVAGTGSPEQAGQTTQKKNRRKHLAQRTDAVEDKNGFLMMFRAESLFSWSEFVKVSRPQDEEDDAETAQLAAEDMDNLTIARDGKTSAANVRFDLDLPASAADDTPLGEGVLLPEWNWKKQVLQPDYCSLQQLIATDAKPCELPHNLKNTANRLRRQFQALTPTRHWLRGQQDGEELDLDAWVQLTSERNSTMPTSEHGLYRAQVNQERDLACLLLADLSLSTDAYVSNHARVVDVIRDSLLLFSEALTATGDSFALYGFSSLKRSHVRFHYIKGFDEKYSNQVRGRITAIKPGYYTRMGAAIRQASSLLAQQKKRQRLLLILTDGKPNDLDQYEGRYGIEDTRVALIEARKLGLRPFCVTIDTEASDYLPHLFGAGGYVVIRNPEDLPKELPLLYAQMTR